MKIRMFVNGQAMSGGSLYGPLSGQKRLDINATAPRYRFYAVRREFPGLYPVVTGGVAIAGETYELDDAVLRDEILPAEPEELELTMIELADGSGSLCMQLRKEWLGRDGVEDISRWGSWHRFMDSVR